MAIVCIGNSHLVAVSKGAALTNKRIVEFRLQEIRKSEKARQAELNRNLVQDVTAAIKAESAKHLFCFMGGGTPAILSLVQHPQPFDFILPGHRHLPFMRGAELIPYDAVRDLMAGVLRRHFRRLQRLTRVPAKLVQVETPPPVFDGEYLKGKAVTFKSNVETLHISPAHLRYKVWLLHSLLFEEFCHKVGIEYLKNPAMVADENGFLGRAYWADVVHANAAYGAVILSHMEALT